MTNIEIVPATREILQEFYGKEFPTMRAYAALIDNKPHAVWGIRIATHHGVAFSDMDELVRADKRAIVRGYRKFKDMAKNYKLPIYATPDSIYPEATRFLEHIGFEKVGENYKWRN